jgi:hypothetical protein
VGLDLQAAAALPSAEKVAASRAGSFTLGAEYLDATVPNLSTAKNDSFTLTGPLSRPHAYDQGPLSRLTGPVTGSASPERMINGSGVNLSRAL